MVAAQPLPFVTWRCVGWQCPRLIEPFEWGIMPNERWSLLGPNGCGKSTLLKTISAAAIDAGNGELSNQIHVNTRLRFGMLEQTAVSGSDSSVREEVMSRMGAYQRAKLALGAAEAACVSGTEQAGVSFYRRLVSRGRM